MGQQPADDRRQWIDICLPLTLVERIDQDLSLSDHTNRTALIEAAIALYLDELEQQPVEAAIVRAQALSRYEVECIPDHYRKRDLDAGAFPAWLALTAQRPDDDWTAHQLANRHEVNPQASFTDRFQGDERLPAIATKREYLVLMQRGGYSSDDRYWFEQLWRPFLKSGSAFLYTQYTQK